MKIDCVLTAVDGQNAIYTEGRKTEIPVNFYENLCAKPPIAVYRSNSLKSSNFYTYNLGGIAGGMVEVQMHGYRGGEGMISMVEKKGYNPQIFLVLDGLNEAKEYDVLYNENEPKDCLHMTSNDRNLAKKLITIRSDSTGMAVQKKPSLRCILAEIKDYFQPWTSVDFHILTDSIFNKTIAIFDTMTNEAELCGKIKVKSSLKDWESAKNFFPAKISHFFIFAYFSFILFMLQ
ncbi:unnamed protein product [Dracunculus medinensis]|uniref:Uncharacterized protein n=1 Tax=Dracunculus medinensis TaxID=318479 RepID=A0A0N4UJS1_DRAME|nr:unnamed protein product [Dracunculus medinensis]